MRLITLLLFAALVAAISPQGAIACSCAPATPTEFAGYSDAVFTGRVVAVEVYITAYGSEAQRSTLKVDSVWKGSVTRFVLVQTPLTSSCAFPLSKNLSYLVYARSITTGVYGTGMCSGTLTSDMAQDHFDELGDPITSGVEAGTWGVIKALYRAAE